MTQDEIIEVARQAGFKEESFAFRRHKYEAFAKLVALRYEKRIADLENIIAQRHWDVLQEREACAKICDEHHWFWYMGDNSGPKECAELIRARGEA
jgi:hypothetical protein